MKVRKKLPKSGLSKTSSASTHFIDLFVKIKLIKLRLRQSGQFGIIVLSIMVVLLFYVLPLESDIVELAYSNGIYVWWRSLWDYTIGWTPFPLVYLLLSYLVYCLFRGFRGILNLRKDGFNQGTKLLLSLGVFICIALLMFYLFWGFNYKRHNTIDKLLDNTYVKMDEVSLFDDLTRVTDSLNHLRETMTDSVLWEETIIAFDGYYRPFLTGMFERLNLPHAGRVRVRLLYPKGSLLYWGTAGVYLPFVNEGHIDPGLHPITWPFTILHEMSHGYGYTGEDVCNFWALLACINSDDVYVRYSGYMSYWRYLRSDAYRQNKEQFFEVMKGVNSEVIEDLDEIISYSNRYPDILPRLRDMVYDTYLRTHGISEGLMSYSRMIVLANSWQERYGTLILDSQTQTK